MLNFYGSFFTLIFAVLLVVANFYMRPLLLSEILGGPIFTLGGPDHPHGLPQISASLLWLYLEINISTVWPTARQVAELRKSYCVCKTGSDLTLQLDFGILKLVK